MLEYLRIVFISMALLVLIILLNDYNKRLLSHQQVPQQPTQQI